MATAREILGNETFEELRHEVNVFLSESTDTYPTDLYNELEELLLSYGIEMDYLDEFF